MACRMPVNCHGLTVVFASMCDHVASLDILQCARHWVGVTWISKSEMDLNFLSRNELKLGWVSRLRCTFLLFV